MMGSGNREVCSGTTAIDKHDHGKENYQMIWAPRVHMGATLNLDLMFYER